MSLSAGPLRSLIVTGGAGFIGSAFVENALKRGSRVCVLDALTYAGHRENLSAFDNNPEFRFIHGKIQDSALVEKLLRETDATGIVNFAAESHVDRSISSPLDFIDTNVLGTFHLLGASLAYYRDLSDERKKTFRYLQVSTDEVYGSLGPTGMFTEETPFTPNSPYSASKAGADHLVRAWFKTYGLPTLNTHCSNNYGPRQFPEKLIPHVFLRALSGKSLPVYGKGDNVRDWIHVDDHSTGILNCLEKGVPGEKYGLGGASERTNLEVVKAICAWLDRKTPRADGKAYSDQIEFVADRPGHDFKYAIDDRKAERDLGFKRSYENFEKGLADTLAWYFDHPEWVEQIQQKAGNDHRFDWSKLKEKFI